MTRAANFAAVDLGASSGRVMVGVLADDRMAMHEVHRFSNQPIILPASAASDGDTGGDEPRTELHWDVLDLFRQIRIGLQAARDAFGTLESVGIDSWGCDYGLLDARGRLLGVPFHYRDTRTAGAAQRFFAVLPPNEAYAATGSQVQDFNTGFQLLSDGAPVVNLASRMLQIPDLFGYWLTGRTANEVTNASTSGLFDPRRRTWAEAPIEALMELGVSARHLLGVPAEPGTRLGPVLDAVVPGLRTLAGEPTPVTLVGSHDTASAVVAVPATETDIAYLSSGTWSLLGMEMDAPICTPASRAANFGNELGVDHTVRYLKNVMGLWLLSESLRTWALAGRPVKLVDILQMAAAVPSHERLVDVDSGVYLPPGDMPARIDAALAASGYPVCTSQAETVRCILDSLALAYRRGLQAAQQLTGRPVHRLHIVGGGVRNELLCQLTADATGVPVTAGPVEATALGNLLVQARATGHLKGDLRMLRQVVRNSQQLDQYLPDPAPAQAWMDADVELLNRTKGISA